MRILVTGRGTNGSWQIRGVQLGKAIGADVIPDHDGKGYDLAIVVKRMRVRPVVPFVYDIVDAWPQPAGNHWGKEQAVSWLRSHIANIRPLAVVAATQAMAADCDCEVLALPHHARPNQEINPIRERVHTVGYEGSERHLGNWRPLLEKECKARGWRFVVNPATLAELDIVVALREAAGYPARRWKSNVKLANAQATGTPCILSPEAGYQETQSGAECWAELPRSLGVELDRLSDYATRSASARALLLAAPHITDVSSRYLAWLQTLRF